MILAIKRESAYMNPGVLNQDNTINTGTRRGGAWYAIRDYTTQSSCTWTPAEDGFYTVVVWVTDDLSVAEPSIAGMNVAIGNYKK